MKKLLCISLMICLALFVALGQSNASKESQKARLEKEVAMIESQLKENSSKNADAVGRLTLLKKKISTRQALVKESEKELAVINDSIKVRVDASMRLKARLDTMTLYFNKLVKNAYKNRDARVWYMHLLASDNLGQATRRYGYLRTLSTRMNEQAADIKEAKALLDAELEQLKVLRSKAKVIMDENSKVLAELKKEESQAQTMIAQLSKQKKKYQNDLATKKKQVAALNKELEKAITSTTKKSSKPVDVKLAGEFEANKGKLPWPCDGTLVGRFGKRKHPVYTSLELPFSNGVDIGVLKGTEVKSVFNGEVKRVIVMPGYGKCVLVQHGSYFTFYCKLGAVAVKAGDKIKTGQVVGTVDTVDGQTQVHFQLWKGTKPQDPEDWLRAL